jgi:CO/xanthine dehydrogenase Mo-binding subunit
MSEQLKVDPIDLRLANLLPPHSRTISGFRITSNGMREALEKVREGSDWDNKFRQMPLGKGIGIGCGFFISGSGLPIHWDPNRFPHATVHIQVDMDGGVTVHTGAADIGQGSTTAVAQVVAEVLALPLEMIHVRSHESDTSPVDLGSYSSRVTFMNANAAIRAALEIREQLLKAAWEVLGYHPNNLVLNDRRIYYKHDPAIGISYLKALHKAQEDKGALIASGAYRSPPMGGVHKGAAAGLAPAYSFSAYVAEVDVDVETGLIKCTNVWAAHDCGKALNPLAVKGQIIGSCHMGLGQVLSEKMVYGRTGHLQNPNLLEYKIPSVHEMPHVEPIIIESCDPEGPFGAKEAGEGPLLPILPAVVNAVYDAIGIRLRDLPLTPDVVFKGIEKGMKAAGVDDPLDLESPRVEHGDLQPILVKRAAEHKTRDRSRQRSEDTSPYVNGVLFGFDPNLPLEDQVEG